MTRVQKRRFSRGQALVEYVLAVALIAGVFSVINISTNKFVGNLWKTMAKEIAAGCPDCEASPQITGNN
ncbi:MAG: hypothetical protein AB7F43_01525 [Bacteriovoracia bacterium]